MVTFLWKAEVSVVKMFHMIWCQTWSVVSGGQEIVFFFVKMCCFDNSGKLDSNIRTSSLYQPSFPLFTGWCLKYFFIGNINNQNGSCPQLHLKNILYVEVYHFTLGTAAMTCIHLRRCVLFLLVSCKDCRCLASCKTSQTCQVLSKKKLGLMKITMNCTLTQVHILYFSQMLRSLCFTCVFLFSAT